jgi:spermidine synthase
MFVYGCIELAVTVFALLTPVFLRGLDAGYIVLFRSGVLSTSTILTMQIFISAAVLVIPTILMGMTLPILAGMVVRSAKSTGWETGILYSINTLGALAGAGITGFYTIRLLGIYPAYFIAIGCNAAIGIAAILLSRKFTITPSEPVDTPPVIPESWRFRQKGLRLAILAWLFITGFVAMGYEIIWIRTVVHLLKAEIYTFSSVLCIYLIGYAAGVFTGGRLAKKTSGVLEVFGLIAPLIGICGVLYLPALTHILDMKPLWNYTILKFLLSIFGYLPHLYLCLLFFFIPSFLMGISFPLLVQAYRNTGGRSGSTVSKTYGINTIGCVLGSTAAGFVLIPLLGAQKAMIVLGLTAVFSGVSVFFFIKKGVLTAAGSVLSGVCIAAIILQPNNIVPNWINQCEGKGTYTVKLVDFIEGITTTASVHQYSDGSKVISTAGYNVAGDALALRQTQKMQGHFPVIMHGGARTICTVGFGSGELTRLLTCHGIPDITCVEISPEMVRLSKRHFSKINLGDDLEKKVHMVYMDAKNFMHLSGKKFDIIENDCIWPGTFAESSSLYTREYFMDARRRLNDDGLFSTWLTLDLPETTLLSIIRTFNDVFENMLFVYPDYAPDRHILLVGQKKAHPYNYHDAAIEMAKPPVRESLSLIGIDNLDDLLGSIVADTSSLGTFSGKAAMNSDYFPFVEFDMNRSRLIDDRFITWKNLGFILHNTSRVNYSHLLSFAGLDSATRTGTIDRLARYEDANEYLLESFCMHSADERLSLVNKGLSIAPENQGLKRMRRLLTGSE